MLERRFSNISVLNLQYAFYFLVVGAAIWVSSWAGEFSTVSVFSFFFVFSERFGFLFLSFFFFLGLLVSIENSGMIGKFGCRNCMLDVEWGEAIDQDEDHVLGSGSEPRHPVLRYRGPDVGRRFRH